MLATPALPDTILARDFQQLLAIPALPDTALVQVFYILAGHPSTARQWLSAGLRRSSLVLPVCWSSQPAIFAHYKTADLFGRLLVGYSGILVLELWQDGRLWSEILSRSVFMFVEVKQGGEAPKRL